jgi:two-component system sensor histidine kinase AlgZ
LGPRAGGRRYLSEDRELLDRIAGVIFEQVERMRSSEMQELVSQAELRALQAQINPHFFFNALNTLYGSIPRESATARKLVLDLAELFRVSFAPERSMFRIEEELRIVRAYLEIEQLRLGDRLRATIEADPAALQAEIPILSIQPLVENAIRHGVAPRPEGGFVSLKILAAGEAVTVEVTNSGCVGGGQTKGHGVGLSNVRRRLELCFGGAERLSISSGKDVTTVRFSAPVGVRVSSQSLAGTTP